MQAMLDHYLELRDLIGNDAPVILCGRRSSLEEVARLQVMEKGRYTYMADVIKNEEGETLKVCYDRISWM